jgi:hypothetical protein
MVGLALALVLSVALSSGARAEKYYINHDVWGWYQQYLHAIGNGTKPGAFAISKDGQSAFYSWCEETRCIAGPSYSQTALNSCEREYGKDCVVFAVRDEIKVEYEIVGDGASAPAAASPPLAATAPSNTVVRISSALRDEVERYLKNSDSFGNYYRFLAVNAAGDRIGISNCTKMTTWMTDACGGASSPYEGAKRVALSDCGGADKCHLIFEGSRKIGAFEIEWYDGNDPTGATLLKTVETPQLPNNTNPAPSAPTALASAEPAAPAPVVQPKPSLKIAVSPELQSDIDAYLHGAQSTARLWAFAIAKDGSDGATASCPAGGGWSGGGACEPVKGGPQELANREAIKRCGGPDDCVLLYVGEKKAADVEIVVQ